MPNKGNDNNLNQHDADLWLFLTSPVNNFNTMMTYSRQTMSHKMILWLLICEITCTDKWWCCIIILKYAPCLKETIFHRTLHIVDIIQYIMLLWYCRYDILYMIAVLYIWPMCVVNGVRSPRGFTAKWRQGLKERHARSYHCTCSASDKSILEINWEYKMRIKSEELSIFLAFNRFCLAEL